MLITDACAVVAGENQAPTAARTAITIGAIDAPSPRFELTLLLLPHLLCLLSWVPLPQRLAPFALNG